MKNAWLSFLLIGVIACGSFGLSQAQTPADEVPLVPLQKQEEPPPQMRRDLSKIFASPPEPPEAIPPSKMRWETHEQLHVIHPGGHGDQDFYPPTPECGQAIDDALNARALVPAPDQPCADLMEKALAVRLQSER
jgi:hypothetical protein